MYVVYEPDIASLHRYIEGLGNCFVSVGWFGDLRHSHASLLIALGESAISIRDRLGHSSVQTTLGTYAHLYPRANRAVADRLNDLGGGLDG